MIPTLHNGPVSIAETAKDIVAYIVRHSLKNPGFTSSLIENSIVSFRVLEAANPGRDALIESYTEALSEALRANLPEIKTSVSIDWEAKNGSNDYSLTITVTGEDGVTILTHNKVLITKDDIKINFDPA